jgi:hypothetical protein
MIERFREACRDEERLGEALMFGSFAVGQAEESGDH